MASTSWELGTKNRATLRLGESRHEQHRWTALLHQVSSNISQIHRKFMRTHESHTQQYRQTRYDKIHVHSFSPTTVTWIKQQRLNGLSEIMIYRRPSRDEFRSSGVQRWASDLLQAARSQLSYDSSPRAVRVSEKWVYLSVSSFGAFLVLGDCWPFLPFLPSLSCTAWARWPYTVREWRGCKGRAAGPCHTISPKLWFERRDGRLSANASDLAHGTKVNTAVTGQEE